MTFFFFGGGRRSDSRYSSRSKSGDISLWRRLTMRMWRASSSGPTAT